MEQKVRIFTVSTFALLGALCISSGMMYSSLQEKKQQQKILVVVQEKRVSKDSVVLKLKNFELEVNTPLSVKIVDYLDCAVSDEVLANLKLDTSSVNVTQPGTYQYAIYYKDEPYYGNIVIKEKPVTNVVQSITLKTLNIKVGTVLSNDISNYVIEPLTDDVKSHMTLDISQVNSLQAATYQYTITYQNSIYTSNIIVVNDQPVLSAEDESSDELDKDEKQDVTSDTNSDSSLQEVTP